MQDAQVGQAVAAQAAVGLDEDERDEAGASERREHEIAQKRQPESASKDMGMMTAAAPASRQSTKRTMRRRGR